MRIARRHSVRHDDAAEALARALEIAVRERDRIRAETAEAWFATVVRREALRVRRDRRRECSLDAAQHDAVAEDPEPAQEPDPRLPTLRAAMQQLKPDERRALLLFYAMDADRGDGGRYRRIMRATGWSHTKVDRCLKEGRAALRGLLAYQPLAADRASASAGTRDGRRPAGRDSPEATRASGRAA